MHPNVYYDLLRELKSSVSIFLPDEEQLGVELEDDIRSIIDSIDYSRQQYNIDGEVMTVAELIQRLSESNEKNDRQKCIEDIAILRGALADIEVAFSNSVDSLNAIVVAIRDKAE